MRTPQRQREGLPAKREARIGGKAFSFPSHPLMEASTLSPPVRRPVGAPLARVGPPGMVTGQGAGAQARTIHRLL